jgi:molybdopterin molybdotransferase
MGAKPLLSLEEAEKAILDFPVQPAADEVPLEQALGRFLCRDVFAPNDIPEFDKSAMDGYAYISGDPASAFRVIETIAAGTPPRAVVTPGQCAKIMTGAMMPEGADRVVRRECTKEENGQMSIVAKDANLNVRRRGEDLQAGKLVLASGTRLRPAQVALLASLGIATAPVARQPRLGIVTTGSELAAPGQRLAPGQIFDSNSFSLAAQAREAGALPVMLGRAVDDPEAIAAAIAAASVACDILVLSGGVSAGDFDHVPAALQASGYTLRFEKVAVQPGMPTVFAVRGGQSPAGTSADIMSHAGTDADIMSHAGTAVVDQSPAGTSAAGRCAFGLPGNPVSTFVIFEVLIKPLLLRMMGHHELPLRQPALLASPFSRSNGERAAYVPVVLRNGRAEFVAYHGSAHLHALARANGLLLVPAGQTALAAGSTVDVRLL